MLKVGLTGGIGSGKTFISDKLKQKGISVLNTDILAKDIIDTNSFIISNLKKEFGEESYINNKLNRKYISNIVFNDSKKLELLNNITHPIIRQEIIRWVELQTTEFCIVESAIIFNSDLYKLFDKILCVTSSEDTRISRIIKRDNCTKEEALLRINKQISQSEMIDKSSFIIFNDKHNLDLDYQIELIINMLKYEISSNNS